MTPVPIIFIHNGNHSYLKYSLRQARSFNPGSPIYLLGDKKNNKFNFLEHHYIKDYFKEAAAFENIYRHMSTNAHDIELFCFQRWFIIKDFVKRNRIDKFLYLDSDVLLFCNASQHFKNFDSYEITICNERGPQYAYFSNTNSLSKFCEFINTLFIEGELNARLANEYKERLKANLHGGVCDMTAFFEYRNLFPGKVGDLAHIVQNSVFDDNFSFSQGYEIENGRKKIYWKENMPYGFHLETKALVKFNGLHFQGAAKDLIDLYYKGDNLYIPRLRKRFSRWRKGLKGKK
jgi:hypothetical protein